MCTNSGTRYSVVPCQKYGVGKLNSFHAIQDRSDNSADHAAFDGLLPAFMGQVVVNGVGKLCDGQRLQPDSAWAGKLREKEPVAAKDQVLDAGNCRDLKGYARLKCADVTGMHK